MVVFGFSQITETLPMAMDSLNLRRLTGRFKTGRTHRSLLIGLVILLVSWLLVLQVAASGPLHDPLDALPLGWSLSGSDAAAEVRSHAILASGGVDGRGCEVLTLGVGNGTQVLLEYRLEPSRDLDDVRATLAVQSLREGPEFWLKVRYPRIYDPTTRQGAVAYVRGSRHAGRGAWQVLEVGPSETERRNREIGLRSRFGGSVDLRDAYIEAVVVNAYSGPGATTIRLDNLRVLGLIDSAVSAEPTPNASSIGTIGPKAIDGVSGMNVPKLGASNHAVAFPPGRVLRIIEHNGESLSFLKLLGLDGVLLVKPPTTELLREAIQEKMIVYAPAPTATDPVLEPLLSPVAGWYLGTSVDDTQLEFVTRSSQKIEQLPKLWRRPTLIAPAESWDRFSRISSGIVYDLPLICRGLAGPEELSLIRDQAMRTAPGTPSGVAIMTEPPHRLVSQLTALGSALGTGNVEDYGWRWIYHQAARSLALSPKMILYRSSTSLAGGTQHDATRSEAISLVNHWIGLVSPMVSSATAAELLEINQPMATATRLATPEVALIVAVSPPDVSRSAEQRQQLSMSLGSTRHRFAWRITSTVVEQVQIEFSTNEPRITIDNPDCVEWLITSDSPSTGSQLVARLREVTTSICQLRWSLATQSLMRVRDDWRATISGGILPRTSVPSGLLQGAAESLARVQPALAASNLASAMRSTITGDSFTAFAEESLRVRLVPPGVPPTGMLPLLSPGGTILQLAWLPSLEGGRWANHLLAGGELNDSDVLQRTGWTYETRLEAIAESNVGIAPREGEDQSGALRIETLGRGLNPLPGGYAGTIVRVRSAPITFPIGSWVRIEARVKTLGFGGPNQGLLIYDTDAGSELGTLIRRRPEWTTVRQYRVITTDRPFRIVFEGIGGGEAHVDWVDIAVWQPPAMEPDFRPIADRPVQARPR